MNRSQLVHELRQRLTEVSGIDPAAVLTAAEDDILSGYTECSTCRAAIASAEEIDTAIAVSESARDFVLFSSFFLRRHRCVRR